MFTWIAENLATVIISLVLAAIVALVIIVMIRDKKKHRCACGCSGCPMSGQCRKR